MQIDRLKDYALKLFKQRQEFGNRVKMLIVNSLQNHKDIILSKIEQEQIYAKKLLIDKAKLQFHQENSIFNKYLNGIRDGLAGEQLETISNIVNKKLLNLEGESLQNMQEQIKTRTQKLPVLIKSLVQSIYFNECFNLHQTDSLFERGALNKDQYIFLTDICKAKGLIFNNSLIIFQAKQFNFQAEKFHQICDGRKKLLYIFESQAGCKFGGYVQAPLIPAKNGKVLNDQGLAFIFSITHKIFFLPINPFKYFQRLKGPSFGMDLIIGQSCFQLPTCQCYPGNCFKPYIDDQTAKSQAFFKYQNNPKTFFPGGEHQNFRLKNYYIIMSYQMVSYALRASTPQLQRIKDTSNKTLVYLTKVILEFQLSYLNFISIKTKGARSVSLILSVSRQYCHKIQKKIPNDISEMYVKVQQQGIQYNMLQVQLKQCVGQSGIFYVCPLKQKQNLPINPFLKIQKKSPARHQPRSQVDMPKLIQNQEQPTYKLQDRSYRIALNKNLNQTNRSTDIYKYIDRSPARTGNLNHFIKKKTELPVQRKTTSPSPRPSPIKMEIQSEKTKETKAIIDFDATRKRVLEMVSDQWRERQGNYQAINNVPQHLRPSLIFFQN